MKIVMKKLADLKTPDYNVRRHSDKQIKEFIRSLDKFEQTRPFVIDENNVVLIGNGMLEAMIQKGEEMGACIVKTGLSEADKKKLMLSDNRIFDLGVDDIAAFDAIIAELDGDFDIPGYDDSFLESLIADAEETTAGRTRPPGPPDASKRGTDRLPLSESCCNSRGSPSECRNGGGTVCRVSAVR